jgi:hypothetical protein
MQKLGKLSPADISGIVERIPVQYISNEAKEFCRRLMTHTIEKLKEATL